MHKHHANTALQFVQHSHYTAGGKDFWLVVVVAALLLLLYAAIRHGNPRPDRY